MLNFGDEAAAELCHRKHGSVVDRFHELLTIVKLASGSLDLKQTIGE